MEIKKIFWKFAIGIPIAVLAGLLLKLVSTETSDKTKVDTSGLFEVSGNQGIGVVKQINQVIYVNGDYEGQKLSEIPLDFKSDKFSVQNPLPKGKGVFNTTVNGNETVVNNVEGNVNMTIDF
ncbi:MAG: hypothetical protein H6581_20585 [Bacteroidia bacterium]|nr:hypothetical protein [Bacteroidia bacterium]